MSNECHLKSNIESRNNTDVGHDKEGRIKDITTINRHINHIDVKGQYVSLVAPIHLTGQLHVTDELLQDLSKSNLDVERRPLQIGVDEAGRGPLLGSVHVAAAILPTTWSGLIESQPLKDTPLSILTDSKQLSEKNATYSIPSCSSMLLDMSWLKFQRR